MSVRTSKLKNFQGQEYIVKEDIIDTATGGIKTSLNSLTIKDSSNSVNASGIDFSQLKVIGDCKLIAGSDGLITLRIGPAVNSSLFNGNDGISNASVTYKANGVETATLSSSYSSTTHGTTTSVMKESTDTMTANCGSTITTSTVAGNAVHFEDNTNGKFKVYIGSGKNAETINSYTFGPINDSKNYYEDGATSGAIKCAVTNWKEEPKKDSGANGYCANVNFTFTPSTLFDETTDFRIVKIEQLEGESVVATWTNGNTVYCYFVDETSTKPSDVTESSYTLTKDTKTISGVTYLTTSSKVNPTAKGLANIAYPAYVNNKANIAPVNGSWFTTYNHTSTTGWTTWTDVKDTTMDLVATSTTLNIGKFTNPQLTIKGVNINGSSAKGATSQITNNNLLICNSDGDVDLTTDGSLTDASRLQSDFVTTFVSTDLSATGNTDLQTYNGCIQYPKDDYSTYNMNNGVAINPNYSTCSGNRYAYFKFTKTGTIMSGSITFGAVVNPETELKAGTIKIELANKVGGTWMDLMDIATTFSYGTTSTIGFSIPQAANYGSGSMICRITMKETAETKIQSISMA